MGRLLALLLALLAAALAASSTPLPAPAAGCLGGPCACAAAVRNVSRFHISGLGQPAHDMNALFRYKGKWHAMHQGDGNWRHLVSDDLRRWRRLPDALEGHGAWDGALTLLEGADPVVLFDCRALADCGGLPPHTPQPQQGGRGKRPTVGVGDPPIVGVARPADRADPLLIRWAKDPHNPITIANSATPYSGPSNIWRGAGGALQMKMIQMNSSGWTTGLYESTDPHAASSGSGPASLHSWRLVDPTFYPTSAGGGGIFYPLPRSAVVSGQSNATHIMGMGGGFAIGAIDARSGKFVVGRNQPPCPL